MLARTMTNKKLHVYFILDAALYVDDLFWNVLWHFVMLEDLYTNDNILQFKDYKYFVGQTPDIFCETFQRWIVRLFNVEKNYGITFQ